MAARILKGGKIFNVNPDMLQFPLYSDRPKAWVQAPGTILGNVAMGVLLWKVAEERLKTPEPTWVKVILREIDGEMLFVITPVPAPPDPAKPGPDLYQLKTQASVKANAPVIRGLKRLFLAARLDMRPETSYEVEMEAATDETGAVVCGSWTKAVPHKREPKDDGEKQGAAAGSQ